MDRPRPPFIPRVLLAALLRGDRREVILGDLDEEYATEVTPTRGRARAALWYWEQALRSVMAGREVATRSEESKAMSRVRGGAHTVWMDSRFAARLLAKSPGFALTAIVTLSLGIGASTAVFTIVNRVLLSPLPYADPDRLVLLWNRMVNTGSDRVPIASSDVGEYRQRARLFEGFAATDRTTDASLTALGEAQHVRLGRATTNFFSLLGVRPVLGRTFAEEDEPSGPPAGDRAAPTDHLPLVLSHGAWQGRFGGDSSVVGRRVGVNGRTVTIVGVLPPDFSLLLPADAGIPTDVDAWTPLSLASTRGVRADQRVRDQDSDDTGAVVGRLGSGVSLEQARIEMAAIAAWQRDEFVYHRTTGMQIDVVQMHSDVTEQARPILVAVSVAVALVLLIACVNVANLLLTRAIGRRQEIAVRAALGAGRGRLAVQLLTETAVLAVAGGLGGLVVAYGTVELVDMMRPASLLRLERLRIDGSVLAYAAGVTVLVTLLCGTVPLWDSSCGGPGRLLRRNGAGVPRDRVLMRNALVVVEVTLSLILLVGAGLLLQTAIALTQVQPGFDPTGVLAFDISLRHPERYSGPAARHRLVTRIEEEVRGLSTVEAVGLIGRLPLAGRSWTSQYGLADQLENEWAGSEANFRMVTSGYFRALGTRVLAGRSFTESESTTEARRVVIVDEKLAARLRAHGNPIGQRIGLPLDGQRVVAEVVGIVEHVRYETLRSESREALYVPYRHEASRDVSIVVKASGDPAALADPIRRIVASLDPTLPVYNVRTMQEYVTASVAGTSFALTALSLFAALAVLLALVGLYAVLAYSVSQRAREIGIRMALGARAERVVRRIVGQGLVLAGAGIGIGIVASLTMSTTMSGLLFGVRRYDVATYGAVTVVVMVGALVASYIPARRASRVDPIGTLRSE